MDEGVWFVVYTAVSNFFPKLFRKRVAELTWHRQSGEFVDAFAQHDHPTKIFLNKNTKKEFHAHEDCQEIIYLCILRHYQTE